MPAFLLLLVMALAGPLATPAAAMSGEAVDQLIKVLEDQASREALLEELRSLQGEGEGQAEGEGAAPELPLPDLEQLASPGFWAERFDHLRDPAVLVPGLAGTAAVAFLLILVLWLLARLRAQMVGWLTPRGDVEGELPPAPKHSAHLIGKIIGGVRFIIWVVAFFALLEVWGFGVSEIFAQPWFEPLARSAVLIAFIILLAMIAWEVAEARIEAFMHAEDAKGDPVQRSQRIRTLLPLFRNTFRVVLWAIVAMVILSQIGMNIGPLLAGAGIIGIAVGFGAQSLVKDIITGLFILMEDQLSVGDVVVIAGTGGIVEGMSLRTLRLRDLAGNVHLIPFGEIGRVTNMTKEFSYYVFDIGVAYRERVDEVIEVLRKLDEEYRQDPEFAQHILEPLEVLGVDGFADSAVIIKVRYKTKPIQQWTVGREFNRRIKNRFDELGIEIPFPHQTLYFGEDKKGGAPAARILMTQQAEAEQKAETTTPARRRSRTKKTSDTPDPDAD